MTTRSKGPGAGFGWLKDAISVVWRRPKPLLGGAAFLLLICITPSLITLPLQLHAVRAGAQASPAFFGCVMVGALLFGLLLVPLYAGYLQTINAAAHGLPARASDIFQPYQRGQAMALIGYGLAMVVLYVAVMGTIVAVAGGHVIQWYMQALTARANHQLPPGLPDGIGTLFALLMVFGLFLWAFYAISLGQVALGARGVTAAIGDGLVGALKNLLPLLVFLLSMLVFALVIAIAVAVIGGLLALVAKLTSPWLVVVLAVPLYLATMLAINTVMHSAMYYLWRDVCGDDSVATVGAALAA